MHTNVANSMKAHLVIQLKTPISGRPPPHWVPFILDKEGETVRFDSGLDEIFEAWRVPFWITSEYQPAEGAQFGQDEREVGLDRTYRIILRDRTTVPDGLVARLQTHPAVEAVRPGAVASIRLPHYSQAAGDYSLRDWPREMIYLSHAHALSKGRPDIKIAVLDTGVELQHPDLQGQFVGQIDVVDFEGLDTTSFVGDLLQVDDDPEDEVGHGTHIAGIIGAVGRKIPAGISPGCKMIAVRVLAAMNENGRRVGAGLIDNINVGIKWAVDNGADIINMSLGIRHEHGGLPHEDVIKYALRKGVSVIAAAGNDGDPNKYYPGALPGVIAVGAVDHQGHVAPFSSYGAHISFLAPGTSILSTFRNGSYAASSGTSQAAPFVSGAVALLKSIALDRGRRLLDHQVKHLLKQTSERIDKRPHHAKGGYGIINLADAVRLLNYELGF